MHRILPFLLLLALCLPARADVPRVVASILPVHAIVAAVMRGAGEPALLLAPSLTPHGHAMRPSEARLLDDAGIVFWIGPALETFLVRPLQALAGDAAVIALADAPGVRRLPFRDPLEHATHDDAHGHAAHDDENDLYDPHLWLSMSNARRMADAVAVQLAARDPANRALYTGNAMRFSRGLDELEPSLRERLAPVADAPFMVFHDAYQYFEAEMALNNRGAISLRPEIAPGVARMQALRREVEAAGVRCIFSEPQFPGALVEAVADGTGARIATLDPLGVGVEPGPDAYPALLAGFADAVIDCLDER